MGEGDSYDYLRDLADQLGTRGLRASVVQGATGVSFVRVVNPRASSLSETVTCAPISGDSETPDWYFWWSWGERMHRVDDPAGAATKVARVLESSVD
ncbi:MAG TPA: hypothetical protein VGL93_01925 [Streptosporangiaceae bacterium]|jgi:hypothetical protein